MTHAIVLELLGCGTLLVDVVALALPERLIHLPAGKIDGRDRREVEAAAMTRVLEHREGWPPWSTSTRLPLSLSQVRPDQRRVR